MKRKTKRLLPMILVFTIIAAAYSCRMLAMSDIGGDCISYIRAALYLLLFALWGFSLDRRIIQTQALHCMRLTAALMLVWLVLRTLKYEVVTDLTAARYIWYLYYLPMLFIPLLGVYIALSLGRSEEFRLTGKMGALAIIPAVLFLLVITNDLHQQAFTFSSGVPGEPDNYSYSHGPVYFCCLGWMVACMFFSLTLLLKKSRIPGNPKKKITPFVIGCATVLYGILYLSGLPAVRRWFGDNAVRDIQLNLLGDLNRNGKVDMADIVLLIRYQAGWSISIYEKAADINADSKIGMADLVLLIREVL